MAIPSNQNRRPGFDPARRAEAFKAATERSKHPGGNRKTYVDAAALERAGIRKFQAKVGPNFLRVIPWSKDPNEVWFMEIGVHYDEGLNNDNFLCPRVTNHMPCPVCEEFQRIHAEGGDKDATRSYRVTTRYLAYVVNAKNEETLSEGVHLYDFPPTVFQGIMDASTNQRTGDIVFIDTPNDGKVVSFVRTGTSMKDTRYSAFKLEDETTRLGAEFFDVPEISDFLILAQYDEIKAAMDGTAPPAENSFDDDPEESIDDAETAMVDEGFGETVEESQELAEPETETETASKPKVAIKPLLRPGVKPTSAASQMVERAHKNIETARKHRMQK